MATHVVIDGSNLATEGRSAPSLRQLKEAIAAFRQEHPSWDQIVVADATFGHRIDASEVGEFDRMVENGQIVTPPAGAIGRGDAFVLTIADKAAAVVLSNDSFQEFHGRYDWLFEEGRLIGGKPVPHVGWVFVLRSPVRGPLSRRSVRQAKDTRKPATASKTASEPMPTPKVAPPSKKAAKAAQAPAPRKSASAKAATSTPKAPSTAPKADEARAKPGALNDLLPFLEFVGNYPVGSVIEAEVATFSSHGAYVSFDGIRAYAPLRYLGEPAPRSAREVLSLGERRGFVVVGFSPERRGIDVALGPFVPAGIVVRPEGRRPKAKRAARAAARPVKAAAADEPARRKEPAKAAAGPRKPAGAKPAKAGAATAAPKPASTRAARGPAPAKAAKALATRPKAPSPKAPAPVPAKPAVKRFAPRRATTAQPPRPAQKKAAGTKRSGGRPTR